MENEKKKGAHPLLWLLLIPGTLLLDTGIILLGVFMDQQLFSHADTVGHGIPVFTIITLLAALVLSVIMLILTIVLVIQGFKKRKKA